MRPGVGLAMEWDRLRGGRGGGRAGRSGLEAVGKTCVGA